MIKLLEKVRHNEQSYEIGDIIHKIKENDAKQLVDLEVAFFVSNNGVPVEKQEANHTKEAKDDGDPEELQLIDYQDLKEIAGEVGLTFPGNISKEKLINLIVQEGKVSKALSFTEVEE